MDSPYQWSLTIWISKECARRVSGKCLTAQRGGREHVKLPNEPNPKIERRETLRSSDSDATLPYAREPELNDRESSDRSIATTLLPREWETDWKEAEEKTGSR
jgi:hypothetical protein